MICLNDIQTLTKSMLVLDSKADSVENNILMSGIPEEKIKQIFANNLKLN